jgi:hypothetical protein
MQQPSVRSDEAREREAYIDLAKYHRAHVIEITYFSVLAAVVLLAISFVVGPDWAWFLRGCVVGLCLTFVYAWGRLMISRSS